MLLSFTVEPTIESNVSLSRWLTRELLLRAVEQPDTISATTQANEKLNCKMRFIGML